MSKQPMADYRPTYHIALHHLEEAMRLATSLGITAQIEDIIDEIEEIHSSVLHDARQSLKTIRDVYVHGNQETEDQTPSVVLANLDLAAWYYQALPGFNRDIHEAIEQTLDNQAEKEELLNDWWDGFDPVAKIREHYGEA